MVSFQITLSDRIPDILVTVLFINEFLKTMHFYIVQLQVIHLLNLLSNVLLMRGPSAIAEPLVLMHMIRKYNKN